MIQRRARRVFSPSLAFKVSPSRVVVPGSSSRAFSSAKRARDHRDTMVSSLSSAHARARRSRGRGRAVAVTRTFTRRVAPSSRRASARASVETRGRVARASADEAPVPIDAHRRASPVVSPFVSRAREVNWKGVSHRGRHASTREGARGRDGGRG